MRTHVLQHMVEFPSTDSLWELRGGGEEGRVKSGRWEERRIIYSSPVVCALCLLSTCARFRVMSLTHSYLRAINNSIF